MMNINTLVVINFAFIVTWCSDSSVAAKLTGSSNATVMITSGTRIQQMQRFVCERPPRWTVDTTGRSINNGTIAPMEKMRGNVTVIALLKGATNYALQQAERLVIYLNNKVTFVVFVRMPPSINTTCNHISFSHSLSSSLLYEYLHNSLTHSHFASHSHSSLSHVSCASID